jgi:hypothetical protein
MKCLYPGLQQHFCCDLVKDLMTDKPVPEAKSNANNASTKAATEHQDRKNDPKVKPWKDSKAPEKCRT